MSFSRSPYRAILLVLVCLKLASAYQMKVRSRYPSRRYDGIPSIKKVSRTIALTRERFANDKLRDLLCGLQCYELPCIDFISTVNIAELGQLLQSNDQVVITSPQSATVFISAWTELGKPAIKVVSVGEGTSKPLQSAGIVPVFVPSDSTALTLAKELPVTHGMRVLYPTSAIADGKLVGGLKDREFEVTRINTYTTAPTVWTQEAIDLARTIDIVTFASPSAVHNWVQQVGNDAIAVVIGPTSAEAARTAGFKSVHAPSVGSKGLAPWAELIRKLALQEG